MLATSHYDRHATYVALSRHRQAASVFYAAEDFKSSWAKKDVAPTEARRRFLDVLSRARPKELAHDYLEREPTLSTESLEAARQRAAEQCSKSIKPASTPGRMTRARTAHTASTARISMSRGWSRQRRGSAR